jgi:aryl-alcohol dehydrogenase-like predicted oxidoreductase
VDGLFGLGRAGHGTASRADQRLAGRGESNGPGAAEVERCAEFAFEGQIAQDEGIVFSPWHPGTVPRGSAGEPFLAVIDPIAQQHGATPQQIALAWQLHRTPGCLPIPGTTNVEHLKDNLAAVTLRLTQAEVDAVTNLASEDIG